MQIKSKVTIVDYGMGNLFSVKNACERAGLEAEITHSEEKIASADAVILPGVGAFGSAMKALREMGLVETLRQAAFSSRPFVGICLGMQLLMSESHEFGRHKGLDVIKGSVVRFDNPSNNGKRLKVPQVGWNRVCKAKYAKPWENSLLAETEDNEFMYFVHSFYVQLEDNNIALSVSNYGDIEFCSALQHNNIFACQFHPERSGAAGLKLYKRLAVIIEENSKRDI